jgi:(4S)-4-hydroxy-5-phosphonooxypentane-2,3-dione isomerase
LLTVVVSIRVKPEHIEAFMSATVEDVRASLQDQGVVRFDLIQQTDDSAHFILNEVYQTREDGLRHLETEHFKQWQGLIEPMIIEPPQATTFEQIFPKG